jgi:glyoxylase-like metal-dependent hydrolase (beta-lactamase superfamily II)
MSKDFLIACVCFFSFGIFGCATSPAVGFTADGARIDEITLKQSNVYVIECAHPILIDTGTAADMNDLNAALADLGLRPYQFGLAIVTHAHHDHAGLANQLQKGYGVPIMLGAGDEEQAARGEDDKLKPQNLTGVFLKPWLVKDFPSFTPDIVVSAPMDLRSYGVNGTVMPMPGHTRGSIVVVLPNHAAFVGDEMLGGYFGGAFFPHHAGEHYYQADADQNRRNIDLLLDRGIETFYLGHGGPVNRESVASAFGSRE